jgi:hypothetical protein
MVSVRAAARVLVAVGAVLGAGSARAQTYPSQSAGMQPPSPRLGPYVLFGGGIEDYTGSLGDALELGPEAGFYVGLQVSPLLGLELGYSGALHEVETDLDSGLRDGADVIRHGGQAAVTLGLPLGALRPYALGGIGFSFTDVRTESVTFLDDTDGYVPLGAGLQVGAGALFFDVRYTYHILFEEGFQVDEDGGGRYQVQASVGTRF